MRVLLTCPPMIGQIREFQHLFAKAGVEVFIPEFIQTLPEEKLLELVPKFDGWIIGDDPVTERVLVAGKAGKLKACVKWGIGMDNVDLAACKKLGIPISNTPYMFGNEVADLAISYLLALARHTFIIHKGVLEGKWPKPAGISLQGKTVAILGYGDIGMHVAKRLVAFDVQVVAYDPYTRFRDKIQGVEFQSFPNGLSYADFLVITCALTPETYHLINANILSLVKHGIRIVNVSRGAVIDEQALVEALESGKVAAAALEVFEREPLPLDSPLRRFEQCIFGTHNGSNTVEAVHRASIKAIELLFGFLEVKEVTL
ncbi:MAG: phosphoglycerate dehydrogenase [Cytophagales bacterium]|nr:phosphoglycerate dehydrogenase [Bernardetiaceae bacterium]MDW8209514.1 phosphoglycerate dehydrogenase [Cytophagales bacterium]